MNAELLELLRLDSLPQEHRRQLALRLRTEQVRRYHERAKASAGEGGARQRRRGRERERKVGFQPEERVRDAMKRGKLDEVRIILQERLASVNTASKSAHVSLLHQSCLDNNLPGVRLLLEFGVDINARDSDRWTPLHLAAACGHTEVVELLLEHHADCTVLDVDGNFPYDSAENDVIKELLEKHMMLKGIDESDRVSLRSRSAKATLAAVKEMIKQKWNLNKLNINGIAMFHIAAANGYRQVARLLVEAGADIDVVDDQGCTPLHVAARFNQVSIHYSSHPPDPALPPHIFAVANHVYRDMMSTGKPQCCIISGQSGAGKTESCKRIVQHLLSVSKSVEKELNLKIEQVNPVLEAFGNAQTVMNANSSRFGKFLELVFNADGLILGASFCVYLLEKSRVIQQGKGESNFHIFHQMFAGLSATEKQQLHLTEPQTHRCLAGSGPSLEGGMEGETRESFSEVRDSLSAIGFSELDVVSILQVLAAVLHIGDISFHSDDEGSNVANPDIVEIVSELLQTDVSEFQATLTQEASITRGEEIVRRRSVLQASDCRDAIAKALYRRLFGWIVNTINHHLQPEEESEVQCMNVSVLDIFGFEHFEKNSFEQMCINIANEQLQHFFNERVFQWEVQECEGEGVRVEEVSYTSNWPVVNLFLERTLGILALIDEETKFPRATDKTLAHKLHKAHGGGRAGGEVYQAPPDGGLRFQVGHYAGTVEYQLAGFLEKNRDTLSSSLLMLMRMSGSLLVRELFEGRLTRTGAIAPSQRQRSTRREESPFSLFNRKASRRLSFSKGLSHMDAGGGKGDTGRRAAPTVSNHFRSSLSELMGKIKVSSPHFIRCLKPNALRLPDRFDVEHITDQLRHTGIMETTRIRRSGFPTRLTFQSFLKRYSLLCDVYLCLSDSPSKDPKTAVSYLLSRVGLQGWECGTSKVFLRYHHGDELDRHCDYVLEQIVFLQTRTRQWFARRMIRHLMDVKRDQSDSIEDILEAAPELNFAAFTAKLARVAKGEELSSEEEGGGREEGGEGVRRREGEERGPGDTRVEERENDNKRVNGAKGERCGEASPDYLPMDMGQTVVSDGWHEDSNGEYENAGEYLIVKKGEGGGAEGGADEVPPSRHVLPTDIDDGIYENSAPEYVNVSRDALPAGGRGGSSERPREWRDDLDEAGYLDLRAVSDTLRSLSTDATQPSHGLPRAPPPSPGRGGRGQEEEPVYARVEDVRYVQAKPRGPRSSAHELPRAPTHELTRGHAHELPPPPLPRRESLREVPPSPAHSHPSRPQPARTAITGRTHRSRSPALTRPPVAGGPPRQTTTMPRPHRHDSGMPRPSPKSATLPHPLNPPPRPPQDSSLPHPRRNSPPELHFPHPNAPPSRPPQDSPPSLYGLYPSGPPQNSLHFPHSSAPLPRPPQDSPPPCPPPETPPFPPRRDSLVEMDLSQLNLLQLGVAGPQDSSDMSDSGDDAALKPIPEISQTESSESEEPSPSPSSLPHSAAAKQNPSAGPPPPPPPRGRSLVPEPCHAPPAGTTNDLVREGGTTHDLPAQPPPPSPPPPPPLPSPPPHPSQPTPHRDLTPPPSCPPPDSPAPRSPDLLTQISLVRLKKSTERVLPQQPADTMPASGATPTMPGLLAELQTFRLKKSPQPRKNLGSGQTDPAPSPHNKPDSPPLVRPKPARRRAGSEVVPAWKKELQERRNAEQDSAADYARTTAEDNDS